MSRQTEATIFYLIEISDTLKLIKRLMNNIDYKNFCENELLFHSMTLQIIIISEAISNIDKFDRELLLRHNTRSYWVKIKETRNNIVHEYKIIKRAKVFKFASQEVLVLEKLIDEIIKEHEVNIE